MKRTGEREMLLFAFGLSFPRGERPTPITVIVGLTDFSASYDFASTVSYAAAESGLPAGVVLREPEHGLVRLVADHVVLHLRERLRDLRDEGRELARRRGRRGERRRASSARSRTRRAPRPSAPFGSQASSAVFPLITFGFAGSQKIETRFCERPMSVSDAKKRRRVVAAAVLADPDRERALGGAGQRQRRARQREQAGNPRRRLSSRDLTPS